MTYKTCNNRTNHYNSRTSRDFVQDNLNQKESEEEAPRDILTIPYNSKIHAILLEKGKPSYQKQLFM